MRDTSMQAKHHEGVLQTLRHLYRIGQTPPPHERQALSVYIAEHCLEADVKAVTPDHFVWWPAPGPL